MQVGVLDAPQPDRLGHRCPGRLVQFGSVGLLVIVLVDDPACPGNGFIEQALQPHGVARTRLERSTVIAKHGTETDVSKLDVGISPLPGRLEQQPKMFSLPGINHVEHLVGIEFLDTVPDRRQVGGGVGEGPVSLANDERRVVALDEHTDSPLAVGSQPLLLETLDNTGQHRLVMAFSKRQVEADPQPTVDTLHHLQARWQKLLPQRPVLGVTGV